MREKTFGINRLILPIVYVDCDQLDSDYVAGTDPVADLIRSRNYTEWQKYRFKSFDDEQVGSAIALLAKTIKVAIREVEAIIKASESVGAKAPPTAPTQTATDATGFVSSPVNIDKVIFDVPIVRGSHSFDVARHAAVTYDNTYYAYTDQYDEVIHARELADPAELSKLYDYLSKFVNELRPIFLDMVGCIKISGLINPQSRSITILVDNSGSMRGARIVYVASWLLLMTEWIEQLGIKVQILGYTTRAWKGGQSREAWLQDGKPANPGRLNDLRHIIFKSFDDSFLESSISFAILVREGLLKENIDGEAVLWASSRAVKSGAQRNSIYVMSDGAPVDDSTLSVNEPNFIHRHMIDVADRLSKLDAIDIVGIGIEYSNSYIEDRYTVYDLKSIGAPFLLSFAKQFGWGLGSGIDTSKRVWGEPSKKADAPIRKPRHRKSRQLMLPKGD